MLYGSPYGRYGEAAFGGSTSPKDGGSAVSGPSDDVIALRHLRAGGGDCFGRLIARWSSFMHVSVYLEAESPCQFPVFQTTHFGALVRLLFHELLGLQLRRRRLPLVFNTIHDIPKVIQRKKHPKDYIG